MKDKYIQYIKGKGEKDGLHVSRQEFHSRSKSKALKKIKNKSSESLAFKRYKNTGEY